ncbi:MAG: ABC transporter ATP-binding protein [Clostridia bacterium]|nr:ABC transporter ATP-binding protein [Clostridia bacterium]
MKTVFAYLKGYYGRMAFGFLIKLAGVCSELLLPFILSHILENVVKRDVQDILFWGGLMLLCAGLGCVLNLTANRMAARVSRNFAETMRKNLFAKILHLSAAQTDKFTIPSLESRITTDTYNVHHFVNMMQRIGVRAPIILIGGITITLLMDAALSLTMIAILPFIFITVFCISRKGVPLYAKIQRSVDNMVRVVREDVQGIRVIKALSKVDHEHRRYDNVNQTLVSDEKRAGRIMSSVNPIMVMFMNMGSVAVIALSGNRVSQGLSQPETIIAFMQYFTMISMSMMTVSNMFMMYTKSAASAKRIEEVLQTEEDISVYSKEEYKDKETDARIVFDNVSFSYNGKRDNLKNLSFSIPKGGTLGIIGATGSGKSTLVKLLLRFYDVNQGGIFLNGEDIRTIEKDKLYAMFGTALQFDFLYADTIAENIKFGRNITDEAVEEAAKIAQAHQFITEFKDGYKHMLSPHGTNISGGQKQRVLISRALAAKPEILVLDDSSSALDYKTDAALRQALKESLKDCTVVTVAQRVSSVKDCGLIIVLEDGEVIGMGTHEELLSSCDAYKEISDSQMGGAFVE